MPVEAELGSKLMNVYVVDKCSPGFQNNLGRVQKVRSACLHSTSTETDTKSWFA